MLINRKLLSLVTLLFICSALAAYNFTYNIKEFGAKGNGTSLDTEAIQKAIDACHSNKQEELNHLHSIAICSNIFLLQLVY